MAFKNIRNNFNRTKLIADFISGKYEAHSAKQLYGTLGSTAITASGGQIITDGGYTYHVFVEPGTFAVENGSNDIECLIIAGGASGGADGYHSGGGGAGGVLHSNSFSVSVGESFPVAVGGGGAGATFNVTSPSDNWVAGNPGSPSHVGVVTALGGGGGGNYANAPDGPGQAGGSGGGGAWGSYTGGPATQTPVGSFTAYANDGGDGGGPPAGVYGTGGGGGAGAAGVDGGPTVSGDGGAGQPFTSFPAPVLAPALTAAGVPAPQVSAWTSAVGPTGVFAGGGGGSAYGPGTPGLDTSGGIGGGGDGGSPAGNAATPGINYTGSGGGSHSHRPSGDSGAGGDGIVLIRY